MKKVIMLCALLASVLSLGAAPLLPNEGYVLLHGLALYQDNNSKLTWLEGLTIGDKVTLLNKTAKFKVSGQDTDFIRVRAPDGKDGWVVPLYVATKASLAVVKADQAVVFTEPRDVKVTSRYVSGTTIVAVLQDGTTADFAKIQGYDRLQKRLFTDATYVSPDDLTTTDIDINAAVMYTVAVSTADATVKQGLLKLAMSKYGSSLFMPVIQAAAGMTPTVTRETMSTTGTWEVRYDNVNVRTAPDEKTGQVIGKLMKGARVDVTEMTKDTYTVSGVTAAWYHITDPDGWVFGAFLAPAE